MQPAFNSGRGGRLFPARGGHSRWTCCSLRRSTLAKLGRRIMNCPNYLRDCHFDYSDAEMILMKTLNLEGAYEQQEQVAGTQSWGFVSSELLPAKKVELKGQYTGIGK